MAVRRHADQLKSRSPVVATASGESDVDYNFDDFVPDRTEISNDDSHSGPSTTATSGTFPQTVDPETSQVGTEPNESIESRTPHESGGSDTVATDTTLPNTRRSSRIRNPPPYYGYEWNV